MNTFPITIILLKLGEKYSVPLITNQTLYLILKTILIARKSGWEPKPEDIPELSQTFPCVDEIPEEMFNELLTMKLQ